MTPDPTLIEQVDALALIVGDKLGGAEGLGYIYRRNGDVRWSQCVEIAEAAIATLQGSAALPSEARPHGYAGDAIDFACGHIEDSSDAMDFLDNWRADFVLHQYPDYERWLATQRRCASEAKAMRVTTPTAPDQDTGAGATK